MNSRLRWWLHEWDWRPLARTIVWLGIAVVAVRRSGYRPPNLGVIAHELVLGWLLSFGLLTWVQIRLAMGAVWLFFKLDDWTYAASEWLVHPVAGNAPFAVNFMAALAAQILLVIGAISFAPLATAALLKL